MIKIGFIYVIIINYFTLSPPLRFALIEFTDPLHFL